MCSRAPLRPPSRERADAIAASAERTRAADTAAADSAAVRNEVLTLLERLNHEFQKTIVLVTHDPHAAERAARVLHLEKGSLVDQVPS